MSFNEAGILLSTMGVAIGVILEGCEHWDDMRKEGWRPLAPKIGFSILVISLAVEIVFDARLAKESADTELRAALIEKAVAWRELTPAQQHGLAKSMKSFAPEKALFIVPMNDLESWWFSDQVEVALGYRKLADWSSGWDVRFGRIVSTPRLLSGILVETTPSANDHDRAAAAALVKWFQDNNIVAAGPAVRGTQLMGETIQTEKEDDSSVPIVVTVGVHPSPTPSISGK